MVKRELRTFTTVTEEELLSLLSSNKEKQLSYQSRYGSIELKKLGRIVLMQYYACLLQQQQGAMRQVLGYIQQGSAARASGGQELRMNCTCHPTLSTYPSHTRKLLAMYLGWQLSLLQYIDWPTVQFFLIVGNIAQHNPSGWWSAQDHYALRDLLQKRGGQSSRQRGLLCWMLTGNESS